MLVRTKTGSLVDVKPMQFVTDKGFRVALKSLHESSGRHQQRAAVDSEDQLSTASDLVSRAGLQTKP